MALEPLTRMANQIARNFAAQGEEAAAAATAKHIRDFWDPRMIAELQAADNPALEPIADAALKRLSDRTV